MPTVDFATTQIFIDENLIDVSFEFAHSEVKDVVHKRFRAVFKKELKAWRINKQFAKVSDDEVVSEIEKALWTMRRLNGVPWSSAFSPSPARRKDMTSSLQLGIRLIFQQGIPVIIN